jgi:hypothetical protein
MSDTPSARIIAAANATADVTDSLGRKLTIRRLDALGNFDLMDALGGESAGNGQLLGFSALACAVIAIDDVPRPFPKDKTAVRAAIKLLGNEGLAAVSAHFQPPAAEE